MALDAGGLAAKAGSLFFTHSSRCHFAERLNSGVRRQENNSMTIPFSGGCACGSIRYKCTAAPIAMLNCHCQDCQVSSGAPFASGIIVALASAHVEGTPSTYTVIAKSGGKTVRSFCGTCGTPLFTHGGAIPDFMSIRFSTLDDSSTFKPMLDIFVTRAQPWACVDTSIPQFELSPPSAV